MNNFTHIRLKMWQLLLPLLVLANLAYFSKNFLGYSITLSFFLFVPGYLLLRCLKHEIKSRWEIASFSCGLSVLLLMIGGLLLNSMHGFGLSRPLTTQNVFIAFNSLTIILLLINRRKAFNPDTLRFGLSKAGATVTCILTLLPFLAVVAANSINDGGSNMLMLILFLLIALLLIFLVRRKDLKSLYPYAVAMMGLSILFSNSLRGWFITGHDIQHEFQVFQTVSINSFWNIRAHQGDPYNACLSITILPTIVAKLTAISAPYIFKVVFQIIFACGLIPVYFLINRLSDARRALIGSFIFISFPTFLNDMPFLNRQEIAFIFFGLLMLTTFIKMSRRPKAVLTMLMLCGLILSHYSSSYITLALLLLAWGFYKLLIRRQTKSNSVNLPLLSLPIILIALLLTFLWNSQITVTTSGLKQTLIQTVESLMGNSSSHAASVSYSLFAPPTQSPVEEFVKKAGNNLGQVQYVSQDNLPVTHLGRIISHVVSVERLNSFMHTFVAKILQILLVIGLIVLFFRHRKKPSQKEAYFLALSISCLVLLALLTLLPGLSIDYSVTRLLQQSLIILSLPIVIAAELLLGFFGRFKIYAVTIFFALLFLQLSGFVPQLTGGYPPQLPLNNAGTYYDFFYTHNGDIQAVSWLSGNDRSTSIFIDSTAATPFPEYPVQERLVDTSIFGNNNVHGYLYQGYTAVHKGAYRIFLDNNLIEYDEPGLITGRNLLYANQDSRIYRD